MKLSDNLKRIRKDNNLSQEQLAEKLGVSRQAVSKWESGQSYPEMDKVLLICKLFNYNIDELMNENVKEVDETKQSKININKYIDDFFSFITKTIDMLSVMKFRQKIKCLIEQFCVGLFLFLIFFILGEIFSNIIFDGIFGNVYADIFFAIRNIIKSLYVAFALIAGFTIMLHIFKIRYLDYYEVVKEDNIEEKHAENNENKVEEQEKFDKKRKIFIEKKKEKIIIRDPEHSQSKFLNGIFRIVLAFIKFMTICIALFFVFTFIGLFCLLVLSFMFVKAGLVFWGTLLAIMATIIVNYIILELFYNFIINKKSKKTRMAISFIIALVLAGMSMGMILIGITQFTIVEDNNSSFEIEEVYKHEMTDNLSIDCWNCAYKYIETDSNEIKIVVNHTKFTEICIYEENELIEIYCNNNGKKSIEFIKTIINDLNNKELKDYPACAEVYIYTSKENIEKMQQNKITKHKLDMEIELEELYEVNGEMEAEILELKEQLEEKESIIESLEEQIIV